MYDALKSVFSSQRDRHKLAGPVIFRLGIPFYIFLRKAFIESLSVPDRLGFQQNLSLLAFIEIPEFSGMAFRHLQ